MPSISTVTPATGQALRKVFQLLEDNFDATAGCYKPDFDDERIAKETGISLQAVKEYRTSAFGKIKPPSEFMVLRQEIDGLETAFLKIDGEFREKLQDLKQRIMLVQRKFD